MNVNEIFELKKTKNRYRIAALGRMMNPRNKRWIDSVVYENFQDYVKDYGYVTPAKTGVYTMDVKNFESDFEPSAPAIQIMDSSNGGLIYDFGLPEMVLERYFKNGFGLLSNLVPGKEADLSQFSRSLAADILIGGMTTSDSRITQELLDAIREDIESNIFQKSLTGLEQLQNLIYFLALPGSERGNEESSN